MPQSQRGFTLIELSIVLVIIGLIIGGVLTGQQVIQNARATNAINAVQSYQAQFQTYTQNYGFMPGDDSSAQTRFQSSNLAGGTSFENGNGNGILESSEEKNVWAHLRAAGLIKNQVEKLTKNTAVLPPNPFNGVYNFQKEAFANGFTTTVLCMNNVPAQAALTIDTKLDDGESSYGVVMASEANIIPTGKDDAVATNYVDGKIYTLCIRM